MDTKAQKALDFLSSLDEEAIVVIAEKAGMPASTELELLLQERDELQKRKVAQLNLIDAALDSVGVRIEEVCKHNFGESIFLYDDHDGYSRVTVTSTYKQVCKTCGKVDRFERKSRY